MEASLVVGFACDVVVRTGNVRRVHVDPCVLTHLGNVGDDRYVEQGVVREASGVGDLSAVFSGLIVQHNELVGFPVDAEVIISAPYARAHPPSIVKLDEDVAVRALVPVSGVTLFLRRR